MSEYTDAVERGLEGMEAVSFGPIHDAEACSECAEFSEDVGDEGGFSWSACGICGSRLGGTRYVWHWRDPDSETRGKDGHLYRSGGIHHENDGCTDCLLYLSNGDEPEDWR